MKTKQVEEVITTLKAGWPLVLEILEMSWDFILSWKCPGRWPILAKGPGN